MRLPDRAVELAEALLREARAQQTADERAQARKLARMLGRSARQGADDRPGRSGLPEPPARAHRRPARLPARALRRAAVHGLVGARRAAPGRRHGALPAEPGGPAHRGPAAPRDAERDPARRGGRPAALPRGAAPRRPAPQSEPARRGDPRRGGGRAPPARPTSRCWRATTSSTSRSRSRRSSARSTSSPSAPRSRAWPSACARSTARPPRHRYRHPDGRVTPKFINLDMEEYRDLDLTVTAFREVLDEPEFLPLSAGIVLQAYLPDSHRVQRALTEWARGRRARGGAPIKLRIVKGANLAMERIEAAVHGWPQAPYETKAEVDANYKRMLEYGCRPEHAEAVHLGVASHNLFDIAYGLVLREAHGVERWVEFEMLEGMANHQARAVQERAGGLLLYAPVVRAEDFHSAIAYLVRRLDENTAPENFLRHVFDLEPGSPAWIAERDRFLAAFDLEAGLSDAPRRTQDRSREATAVHARRPRGARFENDPDTDWTLAANRAWIEDVVPVAGASIAGRDPAPGRRRARAGRAEAREARSVAARARRLSLRAGRPRRRRSRADRRPARAAGLGGAPARERAARLEACAAELGRRRGDLIGAMIARRRQDGDGGRRRGLRGGRLRALLRAHASRERRRARRLPHGAARRGGRDPALELPARPSRPAACSPRSPPGTPSCSSRRPRRCSSAGELAELPLGGRRPARRAPVPAVPRRRDRPRARHRPARGRRHPHRLGGDRAALPRLATRSAAVRRDQRQERHHRHGAGGSRSGHPRSRPLGLRPQRPEVLGGQPRHLRGRGVRRRRLPAPAPRRRGQPRRRQRVGADEPRRRR